MTQNGTFHFSKTGSKHYLQGVYTSHSDAVAAYLQGEMKKQKSKKSIFSCKGNEEKSILKK